MQDLSEVIELNVLLFWIQCCLQCRWAVHRLDDTMDWRRTC